MKVKLWSINRRLRYTGFRLAVIVDTPAEGEERKPAVLELFWVGFPGSKGWRRWEMDA